jgi:hypothetical protein
MAKRAASTTPHLPGMEATPPVIDALCAVVGERFAPAAPSDRVSGPLSLHFCINVALGLDPGWPAVAYWEFADILKCHQQIKVALASSVGDVEVWSAIPKRSPDDVIDALTAAAPALVGLTAPSQVTRRGYLDKAPASRRVLPEVAIAGVALWWNRNPKFGLSEALERLGIEMTHTPWQVLAKVDRRIRRTKTSDTYSALAADLLKATRHASKIGISPSPATLLWHVANTEQVRVSS